MAAQVADLRHSRDNQIDTFFIYQLIIAKNTNPD
jgi:hypothetical protein